MESVLGCKNESPRVLLWRIGRVVIVVVVEYRLRLCPQLARPVVVGGDDQAGVARRNAKRMESVRGCGVESSVRNVV